MQPYTLHSAYSSSLGAFLLPNSCCRFEVWAPAHQRIDLRLFEPDRLLPMERDEQGYFRLVADRVKAGTRYLFRLGDGAELPDPASRFQPEGVHAASAVVSPAFPWTDDAWRGLSLKDYVLYELHVGAFSKRGTFEGIIPHLGRLADLGITAIELMPIAQFPGARNWGYDGVHPFAPQNTYGGPEGLRRLVDACHERRLAVVLDVVYNHLGPEGNYLSRFGPYFTDRYHTPWGQALNFDGPHSDEVRRYFIENAIGWLQDYHVDALRLDAVHAIIDRSAYPFLQELQDAVAEERERSNRQIHLFAESDLNDRRLIERQELGGMGLDAQWCDDFHHALHVLLTGENAGYYEDFRGLSDLAAACRDGFAVSGRHSPHRRRRHGNSGRSIPASRFVVYAQNHDQIGNRLSGDRLSSALTFEQRKLTAATVLLAPAIPMLFMGEEYGETAPFQYFVSHTDPELVEAIRRGRIREFSSFGWSSEAPDPQSDATFQACCLNHDNHSEDQHVLRELIRELIQIRRTSAPIAQLRRENMSVMALEETSALAIERWARQSRTLTVFHFGDQEEEVWVPFSAGVWHRRLGTAETRFSGPGSNLLDEVVSGGRARLCMHPHSAAVYEMDRGE